MWFDTKKIEETDNEVVYAYGYETHELTGKFILSKENASVILIEKDKDYTDVVFNWIKGHASYWLPKEGYPDKRMVATG